MYAVRRAIHIRTGQHAAVDAIEAWLERYGVDVVRFSDVYEACVHLLQQYASVPELVLVGADWITDEELGIVRYVHETWPRVGVVIYGGGVRLPQSALAPLTLSCRTRAELDALLAESPADLLRKLCERTAPATLSPLRPRPDLPMITAGAEEAPRVRPSGAEAAASPADGEHEQDSGAPPEGRGLRVAGYEPPRAILTAEELAALLDAPEGG